MVLAANRSVALNPFRYIAQFSEVKEGDEVEEDNFRSLNNLIIQY